MERAVCILINCNFLHSYLREENLLKISRRVKEYKVEILNPPREGKKLLVLDVDYTLFGETLCNLWGWFKSAIYFPVHVSSCLIYKYTSVILACVVLRNFCFVTF